MICVSPPSLNPMVKMSEKKGLIVRHGAAKQSLTFSEAEIGKVPSYVAFYAAYEHEVPRVTGGVRLCLIDNLVLKAKRARPSAADLG